MENITNVQLCYYRTDITHFVLHSKFLIKWVKNNETKLYTDDLLNFTVYAERRHRT